MLDIIGDEGRLAQKMMFGGLSVLLGGNMAAEVYGDVPLVSGDSGQQDMLPSEPGMRRFDVTDRPTRGRIVADARMCAENDLR